MYKYFLTVLVFICLTGSLLGQVFDFTPVFKNEFGIGFNHFFIKRNKIKCITKVEFSKADNQLIEDQGNGSMLCFNESGFMIYSSIWEAKSKSLDDRGRNKYAHDTINRFYGYDSIGRLTILREIVKPMGLYFNSSYFTYDKTGNLYKSVLCTEYNRSENPMQFIVGIQKVKAMETYSYQVLTKEQTKRTFINDEGRPYKEGLQYFSGTGNLIGESYNYVATWIKEKNTYQYNDYGFLTEKKCTSNDGFDQQEKYSYEFDEKGKVKTVCQYKKGEKLQETSFIYDEQSGMPTSEIRRDFTKKYIYISRYAYTYF